MDGESLSSTERIKRLIKCVLTHQVAQQALFSEIEKEANSLINSNEVLKATANENAILVTQKQKRCKEYKQEIKVLKEQLSLIQSTRQHENTTLDPGHAGSKTGGNSSDEQPDRGDRKSNKLSTNRQKKKVRYEEVSPGEKKSPILSSQLSGVQKSQGLERLSSVPADKESVHHKKTQKIKSRPSGKESEDHCHDGKISDVFVPETVPFDLTSESDSDEEVERECTNTQRSYRTDRSSKQPKKKLKQTENVIDQHVVVPETVPMDSLPPSPPPSMLPRDLLIDDVTDNTRFLEHLVPLEQSTPMFPPPSGDSLRRKTLVSVNSASPVYSSSKSKKSSRIPPTESQLSVDYSMTQMSPTFSGSKSTPGRQDTVVQGLSSRSVPRTGKSSVSNQIPSAKGSTAAEKAISSRPNTTSPAFNTPENAKHFGKSFPVTPDYDESGQSEASFLILQPLPSSRVPSQIRSEETSKGATHPDHQRKCVTIPESEQRKKRRLSEGHLEEAVTKKSRTIKQEDFSFDSNMNDDIEICNSDGRKKVCPSRTESVEGSAKIPPNAAALLRKSEQKENDYSDVNSRSGKSARNSSKSLKQTTLSKDSFKSVMTEDGLRLRDVNGGARVYVDSQDDPYMQRAIQQSMEVHGVAMQNERAGGNEGFKVPRLPKDRDKRSKGISSGVACRRHDDDTVLDRKDDRDVSLVEEEGIPSFNDDGDLNGSLDPAVRFSFIGDDDDEEDDALDAPRTVTNTARTAESKKRLSDESRSEERKRRSDPHQTSHHTNPKASAEGKVGSKHQLLVEDSLDDMFADDDEDDDDDDEYDADDQHDDRQEGIEIQDGYGLGQDNIPEISALRRTKSEGATGSGLQDYQGRHGENDDGQSSFVREFDRPPQANDAPAYKYKDVVRKRDDRQKLKGFDCKECHDYYTALGVTAEEAAQRTKQCSRHRGHYSPPSTPEHYWSIGFPDTQQCIERGYVNEAVEEDVPKRKRKMRYNIPNFGKNKRAEQDD